MNWPKISCICPTYGRVKLLEEAIACFLNQKYEGEKELLICNDCEDQTLFFDHSEIKIFNFKERFPTLGDKKNWICNQASGDYFLMWDDDDLYLENRIHRIVNNCIKSKLDFLFEGTYYILYGGELSIVKDTAQGMILIKKDLFIASGGFDSKNCGEDVAFNEKIRKKFNMKLESCIDLPPQFLYRWGPSPRFHISAHGEDKKDKQSGYDLIFKLTKKLITEGKEPTGDIILSPSLYTDIDFSKLKK